MRFNWKAALFAPLVAPAVASALLAALTAASGEATFDFFFTFLPGAAIGYVTMFLMFLPGLWLIGRVVRPPDLWLTLAWGTALGALWTFLLLGMIWKSSGPDSGPPAENFFVFVFDWGRQSDLLIFAPVPICGLVTAALYWALSRPKAVSTALA
jgi:hypothetical protein